MKYSNSHLLTIFLGLIGMCAAVLIVQRVSQNYLETFLNEQFANFDALNNDNKAMENEENSPYNDYKKKNDLIPVIKSLDHKDTMLFGLHYYELEKIKIILMNNISPSGNISSDALSECTQICNLKKLNKLSNLITTKMNDNNNDTYDNNGNNEI